jgi:group I intron endonuclease
MYTVYKHTVPNNKVYIGITSKKPEERWRNRYRNNRYFSNAINKYGWENIKHEILYENLSKEDAEQMEIQLIALYDSSNPKFGYNIAKGGHSNNGYHHSEETKNKIKKSLTGKKYTAERRKNQSRIIKRCWDNDDYRKHMSEVHKGKQSGKNNPSSKTVYQYSLKKELINIFESVGLAEKITGIDHRQICCCCNHKQKTCHGFIWSYESLQ